MGILRMKIAIAATFTTLITAQGALAGGIDLSGQSVAFMFKDGDRATLSFGTISPSVSGTSVVLLGSRPSGNMAGDLSQYSLSYKTDLGGGLSLGLIYDQPFGASVNYPSGTSYFAAGTSADFDSDAFTFVAKYTMPSNISLLAGLRYQTVKARADVNYNVPNVFSLAYQGKLEEDDGVGYLLGVAYERPDIALRVALTYNSSIQHTLVSEEAAFGTPEPASETEINTPQSVNLEFQSGVAAGTLVFGSVRWVDWSEFEITPPLFLALTGEPLVFYEEDTITYSLGLGRQLSDRFAGAVTAGYEAPNDLVASHLGPTDGRASLGLGLTYTEGAVEITAGVQRIWFGDTETKLPGIPVAATFDDNVATAAGVSIGYSF